MAHGHSTKKAAHTPTARKVNATVSCSKAKAVTCSDCKSVIYDDTKALNCEKCGVVWKCTSCVGIRNTTYDLVSAAGKKLPWFCVPCYVVIINPPQDDQVTQALHKLTQHLSQIEENLDSKVDASKFVSLENMVQGLDTKVEELAVTLQEAVSHDEADESQLQVERAHKRLEDKVDDVMKATGSQQLNAAKLLEGAMKTQNEEAREEEEEKRKRKVNLSYSVSYLAFAITAKLDRKSIVMNRSRDLHSSRHMYTACTKMHSAIKKHCTGTVKSKR